MRGAGRFGSARCAERTSDQLARRRFAVLGLGRVGERDVVVTRDAAWFTDTSQRQFYRLPFGPDGVLPSQSAGVTVPLRGDLKKVHAPGSANSNGIATTPDGRALLIGHLTSGRLFRVEPVSGHSTEVDLGDARVGSNDGFVRHGRTLYVTQVISNQLSRLELNATGSKAQVVRRVEHRRFDFPTAVAVSGNRLYMVNASFGAPTPAQAPYSAISISRF